MTNRLLRKLRDYVITEIDETIKVMAIFDSTLGDEGLRPVRFRWRGRLYPVKEVTYRWQQSCGAATILHFSVSDGNALYELAYNKSSLKWRLNQIDA